MYTLIGLFACFALLLVFAVRLSKAPQVVFEGTDPEREKCESPAQLWLYDSLKMRGYVVATNIPCGSYDIALALPKQRIAILHDWDPEMPIIERVSHKQKERSLKRHGWRIINICPQSIYTDFNKQLRKIEIYSAQSRIDHFIHKSSPRTGYTLE